MGWDYLRCGRVEERYAGWMIIESCGYSEYGCNGCYSYPGLREYFWVLGIKLDFNA